jgi:hypothetical protein
MDELKVTMDWLREHYGQLESYHPDGKLHWDVRLRGDRVVRHWVYQADGKQYPLGEPNEELGRVPEELDHVSIPSCLFANRGQMSVERFRSSGASYIGPREVIAELKQAVEQYYEASMLVQRLTSEIRSR